MGSYNPIPIYLMDVTIQSGKKVFRSQIIAKDQDDQVLVKRVLRDCGRLSTKDADLEYHIVSKKILKQID